MNSHLKQIHVESLRVKLDRDGVMINSYSEEITNGATEKEQSIERSESTLVNISTEEEVGSEGKGCNHNQRGLGLSGDSLGLLEERSVEMYEQQFEVEKLKMEESSVGLVKGESRETDLTYPGEENLMSSSQSSISSISSSMLRLMESDRERIENYVNSTVAKKSQNESFIDWSLFNQMMSGGQTSPMTMPSLSNAFDISQFTDVSRVLGSCVGERTQKQRTSSAEREFRSDKFEKTSCTEEEPVVSSMARPGTLTSPPHIPGVVKFNDGIPTTYDAAFINVPAFAQPSEKHLIRMRVKGEAAKLSSPVTPTPDDAERQNRLDKEELSCTSPSKACIGKGLDQKTASISEDVSQTGVKNTPVGYKPKLDNLRTEEYLIQPSLSHCTKSSPAEDVDTSCTEKRLRQMSPAVVRLRTKFRLTRPRSSSNKSRESFEGHSRHSLRLHSSDLAPLQDSGTSSGEDSKLLTSSDTNSTNQRDGTTTSLNASQSMTPTKFHSKVSIHGCTALLRI